MLKNLVFVVGIVVLVSQPAEVTTDKIKEKKENSFTEYNHDAKVNGNTKKEVDKISLIFSSGEPVRHNATPTDSSTDSKHLATEGEEKKAFTKSKLQASSNADVILEFSIPAIHDGSLSLNEEIFKSGKFTKSPVITTFKSIFEILPKNAHDDIMESSVQPREHKTGQSTDHIEINSGNFKHTTSSQVPDFSEKISKISNASQTQSYSEESESLSDIPLSVFTNVADFISALTPNQKETSDSKTFAGSVSEKATVESTSRMIYFPSRLNGTVNIDSATRFFIFNNTLAGEMAPRLEYSNSNNWNRYNSHSTKDYPYNLPPDTYLASEDNSRDFATTQEEENLEKLNSEHFNITLLKVHGDGNNTFNSHSTTNKYILLITGYFDSSNLTNISQKDAFKNPPRKSKISTPFLNVVSVEKEIIEDDEVTEKLLMSLNLGFFNTSFKSASQKHQEADEVVTNNMMLSVSPSGVQMLSNTTIHDNFAAKEELLVILDNYTDSKEMFHARNSTNILQQIIDKMISTAMPVKSSEKIINPTKSFDLNHSEKGSDILDLPATKLSSELKQMVTESSFSEQLDTSSDVMIMPEESPFKRFSRVAAMLVVALVIFFILFGIGLARTRSLWTEEWMNETSAKEPLLRRSRKIPMKFFSKNLFKGSCSSIDNEPRYTHSD